MVFIVLCPFNGFAGIIEWCFKGSVYLERDTAPGKPSGSHGRVHLDLDEPVFVAVNDGRRAVLSVDVAHSSALFIGQSFHQSDFHGIFQFGKTTSVYGIPIVLHQSSVSRLIGLNDMRDAGVEQSCFAGDLVVVLIASDVFVNETGRYSKSNFAVDSSCFPKVIATEQFVVDVLGADSIAEKSGVFRAGVGNQGFVRMEFQVEFLTQEVSKVRLDGFGFRFWTHKAEKKVVSIATVAEPTERRVVLRSG